MSQSLSANARLEYTPRQHGCQAPAPTNPAVLPDTLASRHVTISKGRSLYRPGDSLQGVYLIVRGAFKTVTVSADGCERVMGFHLAGELMGFDGWSGFEHRCEAVALVDACARKFPIHQFVRTSFAEAEAREWMIRGIGDSMRNDIDHLDMLGRRQPVERIALFLHKLMLRFRRLGEAGAVVSLPMSREDIAHFLDLAPETVSRGFSRLQQLGAIAVDRRHVEVFEMVKLRSVAYQCISVALD